MISLLNRLNDAVVETTATTNSSVPTYIEGMNTTTTEYPNHIEWWAGRWEKEKREVTINCDPQIVKWSISVFYVVCVVQS